VFLIRDTSVTSPQTGQKPGRDVTRVVAIDVNGAIHRAHVVCCDAFR
jgi:hypothetical protein